MIKCKTIRDKDKLALSSRNLLLQKNERNLASKLIANIMNVKRKLNVQKKISIGVCQK